jgi:hypothetical protein
MPQLQRTCALALLGLATSLAGCAQTASPGESLVGPSLSAEMRALRDDKPTGMDGKAWGVSPKARSIERNLGYGS